MTADELLKRTKTLIQRWDNTRIVGEGWSGDARIGFQFNPVQANFAPAGVTPPPPSETGACCPVEGDCFISTQEICEAGGGTYQGDDTTCEPDPCPVKGACCIGTDCSIETEEDCLNAGGTYQGDDTTCDPNPCELPSCDGCAGFPAFDGSGRVFLRYQRTITAQFDMHEVNDCPAPDGFTYDVNANGSATYEAHYDEFCALVVDLDTSNSDRTETLNGGVIASCSLSSMECFCNVVIPEHNECTSFVDYCTAACCSPCDSTSVITTDVTQTTTVSLDYSCSQPTAVCPGGHHVTCDRTGSYIVIETLSEECTP